MQLVHLVVTEGRRATAAAASLPPAGLQEATHGHITMAKPDSANVST